MYLVENNMSNVKGDSGIFQAVKLQEVPTDSLT